MKILIDEDLPYAATRLLVEMGHDVQHVRDVGLSGEPDRVVFAKAQELDATLLTADLGFGNPHQYSPGTHSGMVIFRFPDFFRRDDILDLIRRFINDTDVDSLKGALVVVTPHSYRVRR